MEDSEEAETHADETNHGCDPEYGFGGCPAEDEEAAGEEDGADHHWWEAGFGNGFVAIRFESADVELVVPGKLVQEVTLGD